MAQLWADGLWADGLWADGLWADGAAAAEVVTGGSGAGAATWWLNNMANQARQAEAPPAEPQPQMSLKQHLMERFVK